MKHFSSSLRGYILCNVHDSSVNAAISLSALYNALVVPADVESVAVAAGLSRLMDVRGMTERLCWDKFARGKASRSIVAHQDPAKCVFVLRLCVLCH